MKSRLLPFFLLLALMAGCETMEPKSSARPDPLVRAEQAYAAHEWQKAIDAYGTAARAGTLAPESRRHFIDSALRANRPGLAAATIEEVRKEPADPQQLRQLLRAHLLGARRTLRELQRRKEIPKREKRRLRRLAAAIDTFETEKSKKKRHARKKRSRKPATAPRKAVQSTATASKSAKKPHNQSLPPYPRWLEKAGPEAHTIQLITALTPAQINRFIDENQLPRKPLYVANYRLNGIPHYVLLFGRFENLGQAKKASERLPLSIKTLWIRPARSVRAFLRIATHH